MPNVGQQGTTSALPAGGTTGQVAARTADGTLAWTTPGFGGESPLPDQSGGPFWADNRWVVSTTSSNQSLAANSIYYVPVFTPAAVGVDQLAATFNVAGTVMLGLAAMLPATKAPGALYAYASLTVVTGSAMRTMALDATYPIAAGWFYICVGTSAAGGIVTGGGPGSATYRVPPFPVTVATFGTLNCCYVDTTSAVPVSNPPGAFVNTFQPTLFYRVAS